MRRTTHEGARAALAAFGLKQATGLSQPSLGSVGIKAPTSAPGLPSVAKAPTVPKPPMPAGISAPTSLGVSAAKAAAFAPTHPVVRQSAILGAKPAKPAPTPQPSALTPAEVSRNFATREQEESRTEPLRKLSAARVIDPHLLTHILGGAGAGAFLGSAFGRDDDSDHLGRSMLRNALVGGALGAAGGGLSRHLSGRMAGREWVSKLQQQAQQQAFAFARNPAAVKAAADICTSCRRDKHYGTCKRPIPIKRANFNMGMLGEDHITAHLPATSANYTSATTSVSPTTRTQEGRPPIEQASSLFRDLERAQGAAKLATMLREIRTEAGCASHGEVDTAWRGFDAQSDATSIEGTGAPDGEPA